MKQLKQAITWTHPRFWITLASGLAGVYLLTFTERIETAIIAFAVAGISVAVPAGK